MVRILGIDGSTTTTGYAICNHVRCGKHLGQFGSIKAKKAYEQKFGKKSSKASKNKGTAFELEWRSEYTLSVLCEIISSKKIDKVVMEDTYSSKDHNAYKWLCRIQGAVMEVCREKGIPFKLVMPSHWRKVCGIKQRDGKKALKGKTLKLNDIEFVKKEFSLDLEYADNDIADAIGMSCVNED